MLSTDEFARFAEKVVLFLHNTSRVDDEPYPELLFQKGGNGFPTVSFLAADGRLLEQLEHPPTLETMAAAYAELGDWQELRRRVAAGDESLGKELYLMDLDSRRISYDEARDGAERFELSDAERQKVTQQLIDLQFIEILRATPRDDKAAGGEQFCAMLKAGRIPRVPQITSFWEYMFEHAAARKDAELFEEILDRAKKLMAGDARLKRYLGQLEERLEELRRQG